jgi:hypothetical protein
MKHTVTRLTVAIAFTAIAAAHARAAEQLHAHPKRAAAVGAGRHLPL